MQGGGYMQYPLTNMHELVEKEMIDGYLQVSDADAIEATRRLAQEEGIFGGFSAGANVAAGLKLLQGDCSGGTVAVVVCDSGLKYLSTDLWK
jgi:cysteine synthase A